MRRIFAASFTILLALGASARAGDVQVSLLGGLSDLRGLQFPREKNGQLAPALAEAGHFRVTVILPNGTRFVLPAEQVRAQHENGWVNEVTLDVAYNATPAQAVTLIKNFLATYKLQFAESDQKKWDTFQANPKDSFDGRIPLGNWVYLSINLWVNGGKCNPALSFRGSDSGKEPAPLPAGALALRTGNAVAFAPDSKCVTDGQTFFDPATGREIARIAFPDDQAAAWSVAFTKDGKLLAIGTDKMKFRLVDPVGHKLIETIEVPAAGPSPAAVSVIGFSPDGQKLYLGAADGIAEWSVDQKKELRRFDKPPFEFRAAALSHNGKLLAIARHRSSSAAIYDVASGKLGKTLSPTNPDPTQGSTQYADQLQFSTDDSRLLGSGFMGQLASVWIFPKGDWAGLKFIPGTMGVSLSPDNRLIALATWNTMFGPNAVYVYDARTLQPVAAARPLSDAFAGCCWSPDGKYLLARRNNAGAILFRTADLLKCKPGPLPSEKTRGTQAMSTVSQNPTSSPQPRGRFGLDQGTSRSRAFGPPGRSQ